MMMWATIDRFFYQDLAGISGPDFYGPGYMPPGFQRFCIKPVIPDDLEYAGASIKTVKGVVSSKWRRENKTLVLEVTVPVNTEAKTSIPKLGKERFKVEESGKIIWNDHVYIEGVPGIIRGIEESDYVVFEVGSGTYHFIMTSEAI